MYCMIGRSYIVVFFFFFFFKQKTAYEMRISDWSSDVCSSDLNRNTNVAAQKIEGVDLNLSYRHSLGENSLITAFNGSWLRSSQRNGEGFPYFDLAGTVWNPPHFRSRASIGLQTPSIEAFTYLNYIGGVDDRRTTQVVAGKSMFTIDLSISYRTTNVGVLSGFRFR